MIIASDFLKWLKIFGVATGGGPPPSGALLAVNNLSDVANSETSFANLGFGSGQILILTDADFVAGVYNLPNPCPNYITLLCNTPGNKLRLPSAQGLGSFALSEGPYIQIPSGFQDIEIDYQDGTALNTLSAPVMTNFTVSDKSTANGVWLQIGRVQLMNGKSGIVDLFGSFSLVYIDAVDGVDAVGNGYVLQPYKSLSFALANTTPSATNRIYYSLAPGAYTEVNLALKPGCFISGGKGASLTVSGSVTLDASWSGGGEIGIQDFLSIDWPATVNLDFDAVGSPFTLFNFTNNITQSATTLSVIGQTANGAIAIIGNNFGFAAQFNYNVTNCYGSIGNGAVGDVNITNSSETAGGNFSLVNLTMLGNAVITSSTTAGFTFFHENCKAIGTVAYSETGAGTASYFAKSMTYFSPPTVDGGTGGGTAIFTADIMAALPILSNGASYVASTISNSIAANYPSPVNFSYPPGDTSVHGAIQGIDAALTGGGGGGSPLNFVYFATTGSDLTGTGKINAPFATYDKARQYAVSLIPSVANQFMLVGAPGQYTGMTDMILSPWVHAHLEDVYLQGSGDVIPEAAVWGNDNNEVCCIQGPNFIADFGGTINLDMSGVTPRNNVFILKGWRTLNLTAFVAKGRGVSTFYVDDVKPMSVTQTGSLPPTINFDFYDCYGQLSNCRITDFSYNITADNFESSDLPFKMRDNTVNGNFLATGISGVKTATIELSANTIYGGITANGSEITVNADASSISTVPVITAGAIFNIRSVGDGILANFIPSNYTPVDPSVTGNLKGIDAALTGGPGVPGAYGEMYVNANTRNTSFPSAAFIKVEAGNPLAPTPDFSGYVVGDLNGFTFANGRLTYTGTGPIEMDVLCELTLILATGTTVEYSVALAKNGTVLTKSQANVLLTFVAGGNPQPITTSALVSLTTGDYLEVFASNVANTGNQFLARYLDFKTSNAGSLSGATVAPSYGEMFFQGNATLTPIAALNTPVKVSATYSSGVLNGFSQAGGTLTYIGLNPIVAFVSADLTASYNGTAQNTSFYLALNGAVIAKSKQKTFIGAVTPATQANPVKGLVSLVTGDTLELWAENNDNANQMYVQDLNFSVNSINAYASGTIILAGENYLSLSGNTLTANPVDLSGTNVTGLLPLNKVADISISINGMTINGSGGVNAGAAVVASQEMRVGNMVTGTIMISFNSQTLNNFFTITKSYGGTFTNLRQALGSGICNRDPGTFPPIADGSVCTNVQAIGAFGVRFDSTVTAASTNYLLEASFSYQVI